MADGFSQGWCQKILDYVFNAAAGFAPTTSIDISLHTADPGQTGTSEVSGGSYARVATTINTDWNTATAADPSVVANTNVETFTTATASWGTVSHFGLWDNGGATFIGGGALTQSKTIDNGDTASFAAGALTFSLT